MKTTRVADSDRSGFTVLELLVVITIIGILTALLIPAIMRSRERARRAQCLSNMRQIGLAFAQFATQNGVLPNSGTFRSARETFRSYKGKNFLVWGDPSHSWAVDLLPFIERDGVLDKWDFQKPYYDLGWEPGVIPPGQQPDPDSNYVLSQTPIPLFVCPMDNTVVPEKGNLSYAVNGGFTLFWHLPCNGWDLGDGNWVDWNGDGLANPGCPPVSGLSASEVRLLDRDRSAARNLGLLFPGTRRHKTPQDNPRRLSTIQDGTSNTIMLAENFHTGFAHYDWTWGAGTFVPSSWANPDPRFAAFRASDDVCPGGDCTQIRWDLANSDDARDNSLNLPEKINGLNDTTERLEFERHTPQGVVWGYASSFHPGGVNVVYCDGHAKFLNEDVDGKVYAQLMSPASSRVPKSWPAFQPPIGDNQY